MGGERVNPILLICSYSKYVVLLVMSCLSGNGVRPTIVNQVC